MDFDGNAKIIIKYGAFTLAYGQLLGRLADFKQALSPATGYTSEQVWAGVDDVVGKLLREGQPASLDEAVQRLGTGLRYERDLKADRIPELAPVYDALCDALQAAAPEWNYRQNVDDWHCLGRELARRFYAASPHSATQERLDHTASLRFEWTRELCQAPFGYREDQQRAAKTPVAGSITVRFFFSESGADSFVNYLAYPFYFMHEYVSHCYTVSVKSDMFTDGWLLFAALRFLRRMNARSDEPPLQPEQVDAIDRVLPRVGLARQGYNLARRFEAWADAIAPDCFERLTHHLAALPDVGGLSHTRFLWLLERERAEAPSCLRRRLEAGDCRPESLLGITI